MSKLGKKLIASAKEGIAMAKAADRGLGPWHTHELSPGRLLIQAKLGDGVVLVGSINKEAGRWLVEIMWQGAGGDYKFDGSTYLEALAYVQGVEAAQARFLESRSM